MEITDSHLADALIVLAKCGVPPDIQELLIYGNPEMGVGPAALNKVLIKFSETILKEEDWVDY